MRFSFITSLSVFLLAGLFLSLNAQNVRVTGVVKDKLTGEALPGAAVTYGQDRGTATDLEGQFSIPLPPGNYVFQVSYVGYKTFQQEVNVVQQPVQLNISLESAELQAVDLVADIARPRETPVAYSNISAQTITERLGAQDLPMLLNSTPGVYATQQGGGDGDARVTIRGFSAQNVLVLIDGVPMNDMFNGRVFWTNWFGLDQMTQTMQVQRGLGASKLALPAIGGTVNIMTRGLDMKKTLAIKQEIGNDMNFRTVISGSTGRLKGDWNVMAAASFRTNQGWVDGLHSQMFFGYLKVNKMAGKHLLSFSAFGAPQTSGQRSFYYRYGVEQVSKDMASDLGMTLSPNVPELGNRYYFGWNEFYRTRTGNAQADAAYASGQVSLEDHVAANGLSREFMNTTVNQFFKPVISLSDFIQVNDQFSMNLVMYYSSGIGGGTRPMELASTVSTNTSDANRQIDLQRMYNANAFNPNASFQYVDPATGSVLRRSRYFIQKDHNDHSWAGLLGTFDYRLGRGLHLSGGADGRYYNGRVYSTIQDLMGGDVFLSSENQNRPNNLVRREGDTLRQFISRDILWGGAFAMLEFKGPKLTAFFNLSGAINGYRQFNHFAKRQLVVGDTTLNIGYADTINYQGSTYTRNAQGLTTAATPWVVRPGYTIKAGANYNLTKNHNVFANIGYFSRVPMFTFLVQPPLRLVEGANNEELYSFELGYGYKSKKLSANINGYLTFWNNRPTSLSVTIDGEPRLVQANGMGARHMGIEFDAAYVPFKWLKIEAMASIGDWVWNKAVQADYFNLDGSVAGSLAFDPRGVKVGDAAQHSYALNVRFTPIKRSYISPEINVFTHNYANFNPDSYVVTNATTGFGPNLGRQAWRMPDYYFMNLHAGYHFYVKKTRLDVRGSLFNLTDNLFISDAIDNAFGNSATFSAQSAHIYAGLGRRWMVTLGVTF